MKRYLVIVLLLVLSAAGGYYYFSARQPNFTKDSAAYKAIPVSAPFFLEVSSSKAIDLNNPVIAELMQAGIGNSWFEFLHLADSVISDNHNLSKSLLTRPFILTWGFSGRNQMIPLFITKAESANGEKALKDFLNAAYSALSYNYITKEYGKHIITEVVKSKADESLFYSFVNGLFLASTRSILIEQVILQMTTRGIIDNPYFKEVNRSVSSQGISFFINHSQVNGFFENIISGKPVEKTDEFGASVRVQPLAQASKFEGLAGWSGLDLRFENDYLLLTGISSADDSLNHFMSVFHEQQPVRFSAEDVLPANTSFYCSYSFSEKDRKSVV